MTVFNILSYNRTNRERRKNATSCSFLVGAIMDRRILSDNTMIMIRCVERTSHVTSHARDRLPKAAGRRLLYNANITTYARRRYKYH